MANAKEMGLAVRLTANANQYTAEFTRAGKVAQDFSARVSGSASEASSSIQGVAASLGALDASATKAGASSSKMASEYSGLATSATAVAQSFSAAEQKVIDGLRNEYAELGKTRSEIEKYYAAQMGMSGAAQKQVAALSTKIEAWHREEDAARAAAGAQDQMAAQQASFVAALKAQADTLGMSRKQLLEYQAAQLGVADKASPLIQKLYGTEESFNRNGMSAKAMNAAMRGVPAQMTDIVTSLQGGQAPLTVFLQQGGQLKDMFGGAGNAARALGGYVLGLVNPFTVAAAGAVAVGYAMYKGAEQQRAFQSALIVSGNAAGATAGQLEKVYASVAKSTGQYGASEDAIISLVRGRQVALDQLGATAASVVKLSRAAGVEASALVDDFNLIGREPVQAVIKLHEKYGILTAATYQQAHALAEQGKQQEAVVLVQTRATEAMDAIATKAKENKGHLQAFWDAVKGGTGSVVQGMANWGKDAVPELQLAAQQTLVDQLEKRAANASVWEKGEINIRLNQTREQVATLGAQVAVEQALAKVKGDSREEDGRAMAGVVKLDSAYDSHMGKQEQLIKQLRELKQARDDALKASGVDVKAVNDRYAATVEDVKRQLAPSYNMATLMHSLYLQESGNRQWRDDGSVVRNAGSGATGIAQIIPKYGPDYARMAGVEWSDESLKTDPEYGKRLAEAGIKTYLKMFGNDVEKALAAYNWGPENVKKAVGELGDGWKAKLPAETSGYLTGILGRMPKDGAGDYSDALGAAPSSAYEKALTDARNQLTKATAEADAAQRGLTKSQTEFEAIQSSPVWKTYNASQQATLALSYQQMEVQDKIKASAAEGEKIKSMADAQEAANAVFGQSKVAIEEWKSAQLGANAAVAQALGQSPQLVAQLQKTADAQQRYVAALKDADMKQTLAGLEEWRRSASEQAKLYADEALMAGLTAKERAMVVAARQVELKLLKQIAEIEKKDWNNPEDKKKAIGLANEAATIEKNAAVAKVIQDDWSKTSDQINQSLTDALMRGFESGKDFGANLRDTLVNLFRTMVLRPIISAVMAPVSGVVNGVVNAGMNAVGLGSGGGALGLAGNAGSLYSLYSTGYAGAVGSGVGALFGTTAGNAALGTSLGLGTGSSIAASSAAAAAGGAVPVVAATQAATGATMAAAIPYIGWAVAAIALISQFVGNGETRSGASYRLDDLGKALKTEGPSGGEIASAQVKGAVEGTASGIAGLLKDMGSTAVLSGFQAGLETSKNNHGFVFAGGQIDGKSFGEPSRAAAVATQNYTPEEAVKALAVDLQKATLEALQAATDLPKAVSRQLEGVDIEALDAAGVQALSDSISSVVAGVRQLGALGEASAMKNLASLGFDAASGLAAAAGGFDKLTPLLDSYYAAFYSEGERAAAQTSAVAAAFAALGETLPATHAAYRQLIDSQDLNTEAGQRMAASLYALAPAFDSAANAAAATAQRLSSVIADYASADEVRAFKVDQIQKSLADAGLSLTSEQIANASRSDARALYEQQVAAGNTRGADAILANAQAFAGITSNPYQAAQSSSGGGGGGGGAASAASQIKDEWKSICDSLVDEIRRVRGELAGKGPEGLAYAQAQYAIANAQAQAGDKDAAKALPQLNRTLLELAGANAGSALELRRMQAQQAASLEATNAILSARYGVAVPAFASGGDHLGGLRLVGERGRELEATGASRIWNAEQTRAMLGGGSGGDGGETAALMRDMCTLMRELVRVAALDMGYSKDIEGLLSRVTEKGNAMRSKAVTA